MDGTEILINVAPGETRIAVVEQGRLAELTVARGGEAGLVGNVYLGRVERVAPGIQAAFVDVGQRRAGFLALPDARPPGGGDGATPDRIGDYVSEGDTVLVQVLSDAVADKGAKLTTRVALPGRYLVLTPGQGEVKISKRIASAPRQRLEGLLDRLTEAGEGVIVRTAASGAEDPALEADLAALRATWAEVEAGRGTRTPPACLYQDLDPVCRALRDAAGPDTARIVVDDRRVLAELRAFAERTAPDLVADLALHNDRRSLFEAHGVEEQIDAALLPIAGLPSGGSIVMEETAALIAVDVNTGGGGSNPAQTALDANLEAAAEIARQLRLRNLSGLVAVDFVPMRRREHMAAVLDALRSATLRDPSSVFVGDFTRLGLVEMTRRRRRETLAQVLCGACPACGAAGRVKSPLTVALEALRGILAEAAANPGRGLTVRAAPVVIAALKGDGPATAAREEVETRLAATLTLEADAGLAADAFEVGATAGDGGDG